MKKKLFILLFICSSIITSDGQVTLTAPSFPVAGDVFNFIYADSVGVLPGAGGAAVTWDFSSLTVTGEIETDSFKATASTPFGTYFPLATISLHSVSPEFDNYIYFENTDTAIENVGNVIPAYFPDTSSIIPYYNSATEYKFPFVYGDAFNDDYYFTFFDGTSIQHGSGTIETTGDGYGTLITPLGTYSDVERIRFARHETDTTDSYPFPTYHTKDVTSTNWYMASKFFPLLSITETVFTLPGGPPHFLKTVTYSTATPIPSTVGIKELSSDNASEINVYPNPATDFITLQYTLKEKGNVKITILDLAGAVVFSTAQEQNNGNEEYRLSTDRFAKGSYFYSIETKNNRMNGKIIITK